jgi:DNA-binding MarR family transcriptional regulator
MIAFIDDHREVHGVEPICKVLPIAPSTYHDHAAKRADPERLSAQAKQDMVLKPKIARVFAENFAVYGARKIWCPNANDESTRVPPLESLTGFLLRCASNIADGAYYKQVGNAEITPRQLAVLSLRNGGQITQAALSAVTKMDRSTINEMVPRMIERDLISNSNSPDDKRAIHLSITRHGLKTLKDILPATILSQEMILAALFRSACRSSRRSPRRSQDRYCWAFR